MTETKIIAKYDGTETQPSYFSRGWENCFTEKFVAENKNGKPEWEIFVVFGHPETDKLEKEKICLGGFQTKRNYSYEISFVDNEDLMMKPSQGGQTGGVREEDERKRIFFPESNITIKDNSYSDKLEELKKLNNLIPGEESK
jgi:hypothetical protein